MPFFGTWHSNYAMLASRQITPDWQADKQYQVVTKNSIIRNSWDKLVCLLIYNQQAMLCTYCFLHSIVGVQSSRLFPWVRWSGTWCSVCQGVHTQDVCGAQPWPRQDHLLSLHLCYRYVYISFLSLALFSSARHTVEWDMLMSFPQCVISGFPDTLSQW